MNARRISSRQVVLTATFLALAAGGVAACDSPEPEPEWDVSTSSGEEITYVPQEESAEEPEEAEEPDGDQVFYCADEAGDIVDEEHCHDEAGAGGYYFLWHSNGYPRNLSPGDRLDGGDYFPPDDRATRKAFGLQDRGLVPNGTVKTNVVGRGSGGTVVTGGTGSSGG